MSDRPTIEFSEYVTSRSRSLLRCAFLLTGSTTDAEDAVQSALVKVYAVWPRVARANDVDAYVHRVLINTVRRNSRGRLREALFPQPVQADTPLPSGDESSARRMDLMAALRQLPPKQRAAVVLRYHEDLSEAKTAEILGCSLGTVKSQTSRGLEKLRALLATEGSRR